MKRPWKDEEDDEIKKKIRESTVREADRGRTEDLVQGYGTRMNAEIGYNRLPNSQRLEMWDKSGKAYEGKKELASRPQSNQIESRRYAKAMKAAHQTEKSLASKPQSNQIKNRRNKDEKGQRNR